MALARHPLAMEAWIDGLLEGIWQKWTRVGSMLEHKCEASSCVGARKTQLFVNRENMALCRAVQEALPCVDGQRDNG